MLCGRYQILKMLGEGGMGAVYKAQDLEVGQRPIQQMHPESLAYSRSRGLFGGVSLEGTTLLPDTDDNHGSHREEIG